MKKRILLFVNCSLIISIASIAQTWSPVGSGTNGLAGPEVNAMTVYNGDLYAGGHFDSTGNLQVNKIAKWDGTNWSALGSGLSTGANVFAMAVYNSELYVAGAFIMAGGINVYHIAKWDGSSWSALGTGVGSVVYSLCVYNGELYVGGNFATAGGIPVALIAKWNGTTWSGVGIGVNSVVRAMAVYQGELYVGGDFTFAGGLTANHIARWDGTNWDTVGTGVAPNGVTSLAVYNNELYVGGSFTTAGGIAVNNIVRWNGTNWMDAGGGLTGNPYYVKSLVVFNGLLYAGGYFMSSSSTTVNHVASWDGTTWSALGGGTNNFVMSLMDYRGELYAGGTFTMAGGIPASHIARWVSQVLPSASLSVNSNSVCTNSCNSFSNLSQNASAYQWIFPGGSPGLSTDTNPQNICYNTSGQFDVTLIATNGAGSDTLIIPNYITVLPSPTAFSIVQQADTLFAPSGFPGYQWYLNNAPISNANNDYYVTSQNGNFNVVLTDSNGCQAGAGIFISNTGTFDRGNLDHNLIISPNPASREISILHTSPEPISISIYTLQGTKIISETLRSPEAVIDVHCFSAGIYFLSSKNSKGVVVKKFVKE